MTAVTTPPRWDMTPIFPSLESPAFAAAFQALRDQIAALRATFDAAGVQKRDAAPLDDATVAAFERVTTALNATLSEMRTLGAYINAFTSTDSRDAVAQARESELDRENVALAQLATRYTAWLGGLDIPALIARSSLAAEHAYALTRARERARHLMSPAEEDLAAELNTTGAGAWAKLYGTFASQILVTIPDGAGQVEQVPMSVARTRASAADRGQRQRAYAAELDAWRANAVPIAAALNSVKGQVITLSRRRGWASPLDAAIFDAGIDHATLDAMLAASRDAFPDFRRYLRAKARALGVDRLGFYDIFAPVSGDSGAWDFPSAANFVVARFGAYSPRLSEFAARAFRERWVDAEPRPGKRDGAFCMSVRGDESRVLANFKPSYGGMSTLAHELGHGYHNLNLAGRTMLQKATPMTLAETASIFCETLVKHAALQRATPAEQIEILESSLQGACQVTVDITSRFLFEQALFERRAERDLSVDELCAIMADAQRQTYGDALADDALHPYMWAAKPHYYSGGRSFYNFPYMFGLLFGLGLFARYQAEPDQFRAGYDELLSATGLADAATLAARFGIDLHAPEFWRASLDVIRGEIERFVALVG